MKFVLLAALLPGLYWDQGTDTAAQLKAGGIVRLYVPPGSEEAWRSAGFHADAFTPVAPRCEAAEAPKVELRMSLQEGRQCAHRTEKLNACPQGAGLGTVR